MPVAAFPMHFEHAIEPGALEAYPIPQSVHVRLVPASVCPFVPGGHFSQNVPIGLCSPASQTCKMPVHMEMSVFPVLISIWNRPDGHTPSHFVPPTFPVDSSRCHVSNGHAPVHLALSTFPVEASFCHLPATHAPSQSSAMLLAALDQRPGSHCVHAPGWSSAVTCWPWPQANMVGAVVGALVGDTVGMLVVGVDVGVPVGADVGMLVVGAVVGVLEGVEVGTDGADVGGAVGATVFAPVHPATVHVVLDARHAGHIEPSAMVPMLQSYDIPLSMWHMPAPIAVNWLFCKRL